MHAEMHTPQGLRQHLVEGDLEMADLKHGEDTCFDYFFCDECDEEVWPDREENECAGCGAKYTYGGKRLR